MQFYIKYGNDMIDMGVGGGGELNCTIFLTKNDSALIYMNLNCHFMICLLLGELFHEQYHK